MPKLHQYADASGHYVVAAFSGHPVTYQLTEDGEDHLTRIMKLKHGSHFPVDKLMTLVERGWAYTHGTGPGPLLESEDGEVSISDNDMEPVNRRVTFRFESNDIGKLDSAIGALVQKLVEVEADLAGPYPLPTRIERYRVISRSEMKEYCVCTHKRLLIIDNPPAVAMRKAASFNIPPGVDLKLREEAIE
jgi:small subunit ribosomal protein S10